MLTHFSAITACVMAVIGTIFANAEPASPINVPLQYGALGLLAFMLWTQSTERRRMAEAIDKKDALLVSLHERTLAACDRVCEMADRCATVNRPGIPGRKDKP